MTRGEAAEAARRHDPRLVVVEDSAFEHPDGWVFPCRGDSFVLALEVDNKGAVQKVLFGTAAVLRFRHWMGGTRGSALCTAATDLSTAVVKSLLEQGVALEEITGARSIFGQRYLQQGAQLLLIRPAADINSLASHLLDAGFVVFTRPGPFAGEKQG